jgi:hypothetical protein
MTNVHCRALRLRLVAESREKLGLKFSNQARALKNANWASPATPVSGTPICAEGARATLKQFVNASSRELMSSCAGLTRTHQEKSHFANTKDCRVKPGNDGWQKTVGEL